MLARPVTLTVPYELVVAVILIVWFGVGLLFGLHWRTIRSACAMLHADVRAWRRGEFAR